MLRGVGGAACEGRSYPDSQTISICSTQHEQYGMQRKTGYQLKAGQFVGRAMSTINGRSLQTA